MKIKSLLALFVATTVFGLRRDERHTHYEPFPAKDRKQSL